MKATIFTLIAKMVGKQIFGSELSEELFEILFEILAGKFSEKEFEEIKCFFRAGQSATERILTREVIVEANVPESEADYVIAEIRFLLSKIEITDEVLGRCKYNNMELGGFLWCKYCEAKGQNRDIECEEGIKNGLFSIAKVWMELKFKDPEFEKKCLMRIDIKVDHIITQLENVQKDIKQIKVTNNGLDKTDSKAGTNTFGRENDCAEQILENMPEPEVSVEEESSPDDIKIYLAASQDEFQNDIDKLKEFIEEQNSCQKAAHLSMQCYENKEIANIQECKYFYILIGDKAEKWIQEVYEQAYRLNPSGAGSECVQLRLFYKNISDEKTLQDDGSRKKLADRYKKDFNQFPVYFSDINRVKLDILQNLRDEAPEVEFSSGSILQFQNNADFKAACKKQDSLQIRYEDARRTFGTEGSLKAKEDMESLGEALKLQKETVRKMEKGIWDNLNLLADKLQNKKDMDAREAEAIESVVEYGNYGNADMLLRSREWDQEITGIEQSMKEQKGKLRQFISAQRTLISNLKTKDMNSGQKHEIIKIYEHITELSKEWQIEYVTLYEFAEFLLNQREYDRGIRVGENLKCLYGLSDSTLAEDKVRLLKLLGDLYYGIKEYKKGKINYEEVFQIFQDGSCGNQELLAQTYNDLSKLLWKTNQLAGAEKGLEKNVKSLERLAQQEPKIYEPVLASAYNYIGILENRKNWLDESVKCHLKVLKIRRRLAEKSSSYNFQPEIDLTSTYNNLAFVYKKMENYQDAEKYYRKSIEIRERNENQNPSVYRPALALVYSNYSKMLNVRGRNKEAQKYCKKAYDIRHELVQTDPAYEVELAFTLHEYGIILTDAGMYRQAKDYIEEAIRIREKRSDKDKMTYGLNLAETYCCYGKLLVQMGDFPPNEEYYRKAEQNMRQACAICDEYARVNKEYDIDKITEIYFNFAMLLSERLKKYSEAEEYYEKAVEGWKRLTKRCQRVFEPKLKKAEDALEELQTRIRETF
ncbi:MAG: tetratricopeptide repeat protein [Lachnospiraceae bacterium]|nr:tetratricopeptide repeat protein [Lachnospiraceae bacterium]